MVVQRRGGADEVGPAGRDDGQHAVLQHRVRRLGVLGLPMGQLALAEDVSRLGEGRHPAAVLQPGVPADMVDVQVGAHDVVDILDPECRSPPGCVPRCRPSSVPERPGRARLVVADAAIHQDGVVRRADDVALDAELHLAGCRVDRVRLQPVAVLRQHLRRQGGEELERVEQRPFLLDDAVDGEVAELEAFGHGSSPWLGRFARRCGDVSAMAPHRQLSRCRNGFRRGKTGACSMRRRCS